MIPATEHPSRRVRRARRCSVSRPPLRPRPSRRIVVHLHRSGCTTSALPSSPAPLQPLLPSPPPPLPLPSPASAATSAARTPHVQAFALDAWPPPGHLFLLGGTPPPSPPEPMLLAAAGMHSAPPSPPQDCGGRSSVVEAMPLALAAVAEKPMAAISGGLLFGAVGAAGVALSSLQSETLPILPIFFGCVCLCLAAFSVSNALLAGDKFARAWALVIPLHPLLLSAPLSLAHPDLLRATEILLGDRFISRDRLSRGWQSGR